MVKHNLLDPKHWKESKDIENPIVKHFVEKNPDSKLMKNRGTIMLSSISEWVVRIWA